MWILKDRKKKDVKDIFSDSSELLEYIKKENDKINTDSERIIISINQMYDRMVNNDGIIKFTRFSRWYPKELGFKKKNILQLDFWLERGWSDVETKRKISEIALERANKGINTKAKLKSEIIINGVEKFKYKTVEFKLSEHPMCGLCNFKLDLSKVNIQNKNDEYYYLINSCSNDNCESHKMGKTEKYKVYLPEDVANSKIEELTNIINKSNPLCLDYWLEKGSNLEDAKSKISKIQSYNSKQVKNRFIVSKENLKERGFSDGEIRLITLTPTNIEFWVNKGYSEEEAKVIISKNQSEAAKQVDFEKRLIPSNIEYWINKGCSKEEAKQNVSEHQSTFSLQKCILKYGEEDGKKRFTGRQNKWLNSLLSNGNMVIGYSRTSQDLFYKILETYDINDRDKIYFATHNSEFKLGKKEGGIWLYDFTDIKNKKIIEFHGDMYHGNPKKYKTDDYPHPFRKTITAQEMWDKDKRKLDVAIEKGFDVMVIWDSEYRWGNKQEIIDKCIAFINKN